MGGPFAQCQFYLVRCCITYIGLFNGGKRGAHIVVREFLSPAAETNISRCGNFSNVMLYPHRSHAQFE
jgi:hypothetical protein